MKVMLSLVFWTQLTNFSFYWLPKAKTIINFGYSCKTNDQIYFGHKWRSMSVEDKKVCKDMAAKVREELAEKFGPPVRRYKPGKSAQKDRKFNNYFNFRKEVHPIVVKELTENNGRKPRVGEISKEVGFRWRCLSEESYLSKWELLFISFISFSQKLFSHSKHNYLKLCNDFRFNIWLNLLISFRNKLY